MNKKLGKPIKTSDGRIQRSSNTRQKIIVAALELIAAGSLNISAQKVAEHAGVGLRSVFRHFSDMESLFVEFNIQLEQRHRGLFALDDLTRSLALEARVSAFIEGRIKGFDVIKNFVRLTATLFYDHAVLRKQYVNLVAVFEANAEYYIPEIKSLDEVNKAIVLSLLSFQHWDLQARLRGVGRQQILEQTQAAVLQILRNQEATK